MELEFTADQEELRASVRAVLARECPIALVREIVEKAGSSDNLWQQMTALDWPALTIPEDAGGIGFGMVEAAVLAEELGRVISPAPLLATAGLFVPVVVEMGTDEQRQHLLGPVAAGERTGTLAITERSGDWDAADLATTAVPGPGGWVLTGTKRYVIDAGRADELAVVARVPEGSAAVFVVPSAAAEVISTPALDASRPLGTVILDHVPVPADRVLGPREGGLGRALDVAVTTLALEIVGTCSTVFGIALDYAKEREQFGVKIGSFQAMKHKLADMFVVLEAARATAYHAAAAVAEDSPRRALAASMAKAMAGECARKVCQEGIQALGGIGYTWEHDMHLYVKRAIADSLVLGTAEQHRQRVAKLLGVGGSPVLA